jgi:hypothetical protein
MKKGMLIGFSIVSWITLAAGLQAAGRISLAPEGNTVTVDVRLPPLDGKIILNAPELINDATRRLVYTDTNLKSVDWKVGKHGALSSEWRKEGLAAYQMTLTPDSDGIQLDWIVTNLSPETWKDSAGNVDMQSHHMPTFFDPAGDRIFLRGNNRWVAVKDSWGGPGGNWYLPHGKEPMPLMHIQIEDGSMKISPFHPDEAILALLSREGGWILAQAWQQSQYFIANLHSHYQCSEAPPSFGEIGPGQTVHARGKVYLFQGTLDELESKYQADLKAQHIFLHGPK